MQMCHIIIGCSLAALLMILHLPVISCDDVIVQKRQVDPAEMERLLDPKRKRPFCNAFTGCGKKRSDESMGTLMEMNSEPAVEELSRQILSEAKLWETIQEARAELFRRRQEQLQQANAMERPLPLTIAGYRKKRFAAAERQSDMLRTPQVEENAKPWNR